MDVLRSRARQAMDGGATMRQTRAHQQSCGSVAVTQEDDGGDGQPGDGDGGGFGQTAVVGIGLLLLVLLAGSAY